MLRKIESLRKEPKEVRNRHAFVIASVITGIITIVWAFQLPARFGEEENVRREASEDQPESSFVQGFVDLYKEAKTSITNTLSSSELGTEESTETPAVEEIDFRAILASSSVQYESTSTTSSSTTFGFTATSTRSQ